METLSKLINFAQRPATTWCVLILAACWLALNVACLVLGAIALRTLGKKVKCEPYLPAFFPGGQVYYTLLLAKKERLARRAEVLIWWFPAPVSVAAAAVVWAAFLYLNGNSFVLVLLGLAVLLLAVALVLYIWIRGLELRGLSRIFKNKKAWLISVVGCVLGIPVQRVLLFVGRENYLK